MPAALSAAPRRHLMHQERAVTPEERQALHNVLVLAEIKRGGRLSETSASLAPFEDCRWLLRNLINWSVTSVVFNQQIWKISGSLPSTWGCCRRTTRRFMISLSRLLSILQLVLRCSRSRLLRHLLFLPLRPLVSLLLLVSLLRLLRLLLVSLRVSLVPHRVS